MKDIREIEDIKVMGIEGDTYKRLYEIAKKQNKTVGEVVSDAFKKHIESNQELTENKKEPRLLMEG